MAASLVGLGLLCAAAGVSAQEGARPLPTFAAAPMPPAVKPATPAVPPIPLPEPPAVKPAMPPASPPGSAWTAVATPWLESPLESGLNASPLPPLPPAPPAPDLPKEASSTAVVPVVMAPKEVSPPELPLQRVALQPPPGRDLAPAQDETLLEEDLVQLEPPGPHRLFGRLDSEDALQERLRQQARQRSTPERITFPDEPVVSRESYAGRHWEPQELLAEPNNVCYGRLFFEQKNFERYGWDLYLLSPFLSAGTFFFDVATLPYHCATEPFRKCECSAGYCLPGDPVPLLLYPPELSVTGALAEAATVVGLAAIFP